MAIRARQTQIHQRLTWQNMDWRSINYIILAPPPNQTVGRQKTKPQRRMRRTNCIGRWTANQVPARRTRRDYKIEKYTSKSKLPNNTSLVRLPSTCMNNARTITRRVWCREDSGLAIMNLNWPCAHNWHACKTGINEWLHGYEKSNKPRKYENHNIGRIGKVGDLGVIFLGQDKGRGPEWA